MKMALIALFFLFTAIVCFLFTERVQRLGSFNMFLHRSVSEVQPPYLIRAFVVRLLGLTFLFLFILLISKYFGAF